MDRSNSTRNRLKLSGYTVAILAASGLSAFAADSVRGKTIFASQCATCHTATKGGPAILGPNLYGVVGRKAGTVPGFNYSPAMKASGIVWTDEKLASYLPAPRTVVAGTKMTYGGLHDPAKVADLIAYLDSMK